MIINLGSTYKHRYCVSPLTKQKIASSTPITKKIPKLKINPLLSPIITPMKNRNNILSINSLNNNDCNLMNQNILQNNSYHNRNSLCFNTGYNFFF